MDKCQEQPYFGILKRARMFLEDGEFNKADEYAERVLDSDPECAEAYAIKLCCELKTKSFEGLALRSVPFSKNKNFAKALRYADDSFAAALKGYAQSAEHNRAKESARLNEQKNFEERRLAERRQLAKLAMPLISARCSQSIGVKTDGTVLVAGADSRIRRQSFKSLKKWRNIVAVFAFGRHVFGVRSDGTVVAAGTTYDFSISHDTKKRVKKVSKWKNIVALSTSDKFTFGLKSDGTLALVADIGWRKKDLPDFFKSNDNVAVATGCEYVAVLKADGTVKCVGNSKFVDTVHQWRDIVAIADSRNVLVGIKTDGTVVAAGDMSEYYDISQAKDIGSYAISNSHKIVTDKTVLVAQVKNGLDISLWKDIAAVSVGGSHIVGLKGDGTVVAFGENTQGECDVLNWRDVIAVSAGFGYTLGLKSDGTVVAAGRSLNGQCNVGDWKLFDTIQDLYK